MCLEQAESASKTESAQHPWVTMEPPRRLSISLGADTRIQPGAVYQHIVEKDLGRGRGLGGTTQSNLACRPGGSGADIGCPAIQIPIHHHDIAVGLDRDGKIAPAVFGGAARVDIGQGDFHSIEDHDHMNVMIAAAVIVPTYGEIVARVLMEENHAVFRPAAAGAMPPSMPGIPMAMPEKKTDGSVKGTNQASFIKINPTPRAQIHASL